jgi:hypothetical protein
LCFVLTVQFGTPEEVAARVVTAEVNRDGVFEVTLLKDPETVDSSGGGFNVVDGSSSSSLPPYYLLEYLSVGKRGRKVYRNKIFVSSNQLLYVLTAQCKEENYGNSESENVKMEMEATVASFRVL